MAQSSAIVDEAVIMDMFHVGRQRRNFAGTSDRHDFRSRISYTREQKLAAITYTKTTYRMSKDNTLHVISRYEAAKNLGITSKMLRDWIKQEDKIIGLKKGTRKGIDGRKAQEESMEQELFREFQDCRMADRAVNQKWFYQNARRIYAQLYPERVKPQSDGRLIYKGFKFSAGWFNGFCKRYHISYRVPMKIVLNVPADY